MKNLIPVALIFASIIILIPLSHAQESKAHDIPTLCSKISDQIAVAKNARTPAEKSTAITNCRATIAQLRYINSVVAQDFADTYTDQVNAISNQFNADRQEDGEESKVKKLADGIRRVIDKVKAEETTTIEEANARIAQVSASNREAAELLKQKVEFRYLLIALSSDCEKMEEHIKQRDLKKLAILEAQARHNKKLQFAKSLGFEFYTDSISQILQALKYGTSPDSLKKHLIGKDNLDSFFRVNQIVDDYVIYRNRQNQRIALLKCPGAAYLEDSPLVGTYFAFTGLAEFSRTFGGQAQIPVFEDKSDAIKNLQFVK